MRLRNICFSMNACRVRVKCSGPFHHQEMAGAVPDPKVEVWSNRSKFDFQRPYRIRAPRHDRQNRNVDLVRGSDLLSYHSFPGAQADIVGVRNIAALIHCLSELSRAGRSTVSRVDSMLGR